MFARSTESAVERTEMKAVLPPYAVNSSSVFWKTIKLTIVEVNSGYSIIMSLSSVPYPISSTAKEPIVTVYAKYLAV
jgi:hypothetical protein